MAGTFIAIGLSLIAGIILIWKLRRRHKYFRLLDGFMEEEEEARLTRSANEDSSSSAFVASQFTSYRSTSPESYLPEMEELTAHPFLPTSSSPPRDRPNASLTVPEAALSSLVTLQTDSNAETSPLDPIDPYGPQHYSAQGTISPIPNPFRTPRESINSGLVTTPTSTAVERTFSNDSFYERHFLNRLGVVLDDNDISNLHNEGIGDIISAFPRITNNTSWLNFS